MIIKEDFLSMGNFILHDGRKIRFWVDSWLDTTPLKIQYPNLYNIVRRKDATIAEILSLRPLKVSFHRNLVAENLLSWHALVLRLMDIHLTESPDTFKWSLNHNGQFSVNSIYQAFLGAKVVPNNSHLWKIKVPLKIKVFLWLLYREVILTKDNLVKRNWHGNILCCFCNNVETIHHLFFYCALAKFLWRVIQLMFGLSVPRNVKHVYLDWILNMNNTNKRLLFVGLGAMFWSIWLSRNDIVFNKTLISSYM
jgi:hypothetical protein